MLAVPTDTALAAVLFDLDGTLADTAPDLVVAVNRLREEADLAPMPLAELRHHTSSGARGMLGAAFGITPADDGYDALVARFLAHYEAALCVHTRLFDGMDVVLETLESRNILWGVVTNKRVRHAAPLMQQLGLAERACCIIGGDSAALPKPAPDPILMACEQAGLNPADCVYVGDDLRDVQSAHAAGMSCIAAAWGYLGEDLPIEKWHAEAIIDHPRELLTLLRL